MAVGWLRFDRRVLRGRVARRIFSVFLVCSLVPVSVFALFSYREVRRQLESDAAANLRGASKTAGMTILERLLIAEQAVSVLAQRADPALAVGADAQPIADGRIIEIAVLPESAVAGELGEAERAALAVGHSVLRVFADTAPPARIELLRRADPGRADSPVLAASLDPAFVFEPRRRSAQDVYRVEDAGGEVLFADSPEALDQPAGGEDPVRGPELEASWELFLRSRFHAAPWTITFTRPIRETHRPLQQFETIFPLVALAALGAAVGLSLSQIRRSLVPIDELAAAARRISTGALDVQVAIDSRDEFGELGRAFNEMTEELRRQNRVLSVVNEIGAALSAEQDTTRLLDLILRGSARVTDATGGALFLSSDGAPLALTRLWLEPGSAPAPGAATPALDPAVARRCRERRMPIASHPDAGSDTPDEAGAWADFESALQVPLGPRLAVPMLNGAEEVVGVLVLFRKTRSAAPFSIASCRLAESLASQAAIAIAKNQLVDGFRSLFEGVIEMTVRAIDEKSPYTGDHCRKVPILTELIADAACAASTGALKHFDLSDAERYELRIAALLHDCGKVVTPVHVMDKATKLETIFDRIALIDLRCEVIRRDLLRETPAASLGEQLRRLEEDRAFLHRCNRGVERMPEADRDRIRAIAARYRYATEDGVERPLLDAEEVENLSIPRGTLNDAERTIIEHHVVSTIDLLSELPFPRWLAAVPEIAGSHHERADGSGYPRGLRQADVSMQGRILGLADVFEALTARDRPYKPGRTLSETLEILTAMRDEGSLDADLYDLFVTQKVYLRYAAEHLAPEQIDAAHWEDLERLTAPV
jgi:HD-GYP domain-containing protein (c-di-GMP phosphodiesterase class II)/HAMP domain-containing protein